MSVRIFLVFVLMFQTACVSTMLNKLIPQEGKEEAKLRKVKSVAIIAFDALEFRPSGVASKLAPIAGTVQSVANTRPEETELSIQLYHDLSSELSRKGFKVLSLKKLRSNKTYKKLLPGMKSASSKLALSETQKPTIVAGVARPLNPKYQLDQGQRQSLAKSLGVDALVFARVGYQADSNTDFIGLGLTKSYLKPYLSFHMYGSSEFELIWFANHFSGPRSEKSLGRVSGLEDKSVISSMSRPLARTTFRNFFSKDSLRK